MESTGTTSAADLGATAVDTALHAGDLEGTNSTVHGVTDVPVEDWIDHRYGDPSSPTPVIDPDSGAARGVARASRLRTDLIDVWGADRH